MPINWTRNGVPLHPPPAEPPSTLRRLLGGLTRTGAGWAASIPAMEPGIGSAIGAGIAGAGEAAAEAIEGSPISASRIGVEAGLGAVPLSRVFTARPLQAALRSAALSGTGEAGREWARGEDIDPSAIVKTAGIGGLIGGALGHFLGVGKKAATPPAGPSYEIEQNAVPGGRILDPSGKKLIPVGANKVITTPYVEPPTPPALAAGLGAVEEAGRIPYMETGAYPTGSAAKSAARAAKEAEKLAQQQAVQERIDRAIEEGQLQPGTTSVSESGSVRTPEGRMGYRTSYKAPETEESLPGVRTLPEEPVAETTPSIAEPDAPPPSPMRKLFTSAVEEAPRAPRSGKILTPNQEAAQRSYDDLLARIKAETSPPVESPAVEPPVAPEGPSNVERLSPEFKGFPIEPVSGGAGAVVEGATQGVSPLAKLFKSRVDAAGQGYRDIKAALAGGEAVPEEGRAIAGKALQTEAKAAGLPTGGEVPPSGIGPSQTAKAREAALAKRQAATEWQSGYEAELAEAQRMKDAGATPEEIQATLAQRIKGEKGATDPAFLATLIRMGAGAGIGGILGGAGGHPILGMVGGAALGSLNPVAIARGLEELGMPPEAAQRGAIAAQTPEGAKEAAHTLFDTLPQFQRFNLLLDPIGLPANMWAGPVGSGMMAGLEMHLGGDPRGMQILRALTPERFLREWNLARTSGEAERIIQQGELGRAESRMLGSGPVQRLMQAPGVLMTAGDEAVRKILIEAGVSPEEARVITLTSEPELGATKTLANISKKSSLLQMLQPFARTPANIAEQGAYRLPGIGFLAQSYRESPDSIKRQIIQQGLGTAAGGVGYLTGSTLDPETSKIVRRYMSNLGGQYSLPVSLGYAVGEAEQAGKPVMSSTTVGNLYNALPLPTTAPVAEWAKSATTGVPPRGMMPAAVKDLMELLGVYPSANPLKNPFSRLKSR